MEILPKGDWHPIETARNHLQTVTASIFRRVMKLHFMNWLWITLYNELSQTYLEPLVNKCDGFVFNTWQICFPIFYFCLLFYIFFSNFFSYFFQIFPFPFSQRNTHGKHCIDMENAIFLDLGCNPTHTSLGISPMCSSNLISTETGVCVRPLYFLCPLGTGRSSPGLMFPLTLRNIFYGATWICVSGFTVCAAPCRVLRPRKQQRPVRWSWA